MRVHMGVHIKSAWGRFLLLVLAGSLVFAGCRTAASVPQQEVPVPAVTAGTEGVPPAGGNLEPGAAEEGTAKNAEGGEPEAPAAPSLPPGVKISREEEHTTIGPFFGILPELAWSPDGRYLAIYGETAGYGLWVWDKEEEELRRMVQLIDRSGAGATAVTFLGWRGDGQALMYAVDGVQPEGPHLGERGVTVRAVALDGTSQEVAWLPGGLDLIRGFHFNPESGMLLVHRGPDLWRVDTAGRRVERLKDTLPTWDGFFSLVFSPTGEVVAYPQDLPGQHGLVLLNVADGSEVVVGPEGEYAFCPVWSPDGEKLAFLSAQAQGDGYDFQLGEDGPLPPATRLNVATKEGRLLATWVPPHGEKAGIPVWSPGGDRLAFLSATVARGADGQDKVKWKRLLLGSPGQPLVDLGPVRGEWLTVAGFNPDGRGILVYRYEIGGGVTVLSYGLEPGQVAVLAEEAVDEPPAWWQGQLIVARLDYGEGDSLDTQIYLSSPAGEVRALTSGPGWKSQFRLAGQMLAYLSADNQTPPYPISVIVRALPTVRE